MLFKCVRKLSEICQWQKCVGKLAEMCQIQNSANHGNVQCCKPDARWKSPGLGKSLAGRESATQRYTVQADWKEWPARGWYRKLGERPDSVHDLDHRAMCDTAWCFKHYIRVGLTPNSIFEILRYQKKMSLAI